MKKTILFFVSAIAVLIMTACSGGNNHIHEEEDTAVTEAGSHVHADGTVHSDDHSATGVPTESAVVESDHQEDEVPEHTTITTRKQEFRYVIRAGGTIHADSKDIIAVTAKAGGIIRLTDHFLFPGMKVAKGQPLFIISGDELADGNTEIALMEARSDYTKASEQYARAGRLIESKLITMDDYLEARNESEKAEIRYRNLQSGYSADGSLVTSPVSGYVSQILTSEGNKVSAGEKLLNIIIEHNLVLQADVSPIHLEHLISISSANFRLPYSDKIFTTGELNGRKISHAKSTGADSYYIPVYFSIDYTPEIIPGTYAEIYLEGAPQKDCIIVPNSAILEEFGKYYVFVEEEEHHFVKRYISKGMTNGIETEVTEGLAENETVVATGAYAIKMSQMSTTAPDTHKH
ncbi:MAG: efflux RND transporter periplasmic adaptor subunit [Bacteroidales bacterium]|nr:efflux RND transporter periplasmic adaptor subunit [Bacteroidales bacterium]